MSKRQDIIDSLNTLFGNISIANGYTFNIGSDVFEWRTTPLPDSKTKALNFWDDEETCEEEGNLLWHDLHIKVNLLCNEGADKAATLRARMQDVLTAFKGILEDTDVIDTVKEAYYVGSTMDVEHADKKETAALMEFVIRYITPLWEI